MKVRSRLVGVVALTVLFVRSGAQARGTQRVGAAAGAVSAPQTQMGEGQARALIDRYCVTCHNQRTKAGGLVLESADLSRVGEDAVRWEKVVRKLRGRLMPPAGGPRPDDPTYNAFAAWVETELDTFAAAHPNPGHTEAFHRLNRAEYQNAIRDLLALDIDAAEYVPADDAAFGFDNIGGVFKLSPTLLESYLIAADNISRMAMGVLPAVIDEGKRYTPGRLQQHDRIEGMPLGTRGGMLVRHLFPNDGDYSFRIDIARDYYEPETHAMDLLIDRVVVKTFTVHRMMTRRESMYTEKDNVYTASVPVTAGPHDVAVAFHRKPPALPEYQNKPFQVVGSPSNGGNAGPGGPTPNLAALTIGGPFTPTGPGDTPSRRRILRCQPTAPAQEDTCAKTILTALARHAFRRPDPDIAPLFAFYAETRKSGASFDIGIQKALWRLLASPEFLFRVEALPPAVADGSGPASYHISDVELASRLSFFLWSSIPDDHLLEFAAKGRLKAPAVLAQEVQRMLADPRSGALTANFAGQWLQLRKLDASRPGADYGKNFDESLRQGLRRETELFFDSIVREDRPVTELLTADYTFLNERVANHYGLTNVQGSHFRRVTLPADNPRRGLLGQGSILILTSQGIRTSPVIRGKYILQTLMGTPPPDPPPNVPSLPEGKPGAPTTIREKMAAHRANVVCASCHSMIDPLGFGLENFDPVGRWRDVDEGLLKVDSSGTLPDGRKFGNAAELRGLLIQYPEQLVRTVTENLLTYALGRGLEYYDMPVVRKIVHDVGLHGYRFHSIVLGIVQSAPFQMRMTASPSGALKAQ